MVPENMYETPISFLLMVYLVPYSIIVFGSACQVPAGRVEAN
jgi:hypothetical protein